jgi:hypothetical protein
MPTAGHRSAMLTSVLQNTGVIFQALHKRITWGACLKYRCPGSTTDLDATLPRMRPEPNFLTHFPGIPDAKTNRELMILKSWES